MTEERQFPDFCKICLRQCSWPPVTRNQLGCNGYDSTVHSTGVHSTVHSTVLQCYSRAQNMLQRPVRRGVTGAAQSELRDLDHHQLTAPPPSPIGQHLSIPGSDWWKESGWHCHGMPATSRLQFSKQCLERVDFQWVINATFWLYLPFSIYVRPGGELSVGISGWARGWQWPVTTPGSHLM